MGIAPLIGQNESTPAPVSIQIDTGAGVESFLPIKRSDTHKKVRYMQALANQKERNICQNRGTKYRLQGGMALSVNIDNEFCCYKKPKTAMFRIFSVEIVVSKCNL